MTIHDRTSTGDPTGTITLPGLPDRITLRELIRMRVREEVARCQPRSVGTLPGVDPARRIGADDRGFKLPRREPLDWHPQADAAIDLFLANGFIVLINGDQVTDLETQDRPQGGPGRPVHPADAARRRLKWPIRLEVPELTLAQHRDRARAAVDEAVRAVRLDRTWTGANKIPEVAALHALTPESNGRSRSTCSPGPSG